MYLAHELKASFRRSRNLAEDLEKITSQYRNCGTISNVTNFWRVCIAVNWNISKSRLSTPIFLLSGENRWHYHPTKFGMRHVESTDTINIIWRTAADTSSAYRWYRNDTITLVISLMNNEKTVSLILIPKRHLMRLAGSLMPDLLSKLKIFGRIATTL
jgi:hypothetical protein